MGISENDFKRRRLNLICVLDVSGSMGSRFGGSDMSRKSKMKIANECLLSILTNLKSTDRFGLILFDNNAWEQIKFKTMKDHKLNDLMSILDFYENGGTNFESGYLCATKMFNKAVDIDSNDENRIIFLTDACPNIGSSDPHSLMSMVKKSAISSSLYTTFVGVGLDFNSNLISKISKVRGANYFSVHSSADFHKKLSAEFDYFCFPMVFNLKLTLQSEGGQVCIERVYGSNDINMNSGEVMNITTLFPSPPNPDNGQVKGGIVLIKLKKMKKINDVFIECSFEDKDGKKYKNKQNVILNTNKHNDEYYANLGVRKGILLTRYVGLMRAWIRKYGQGNNINKTSMRFKRLIKGFAKYFKQQMAICGDKTLKQEMKILIKIITSQIA